MMDLLLNAITSGVLLGGFYAAVTVGLAISFGMLDIANLAHPAFIILGSFTAYILNSHFGIDPILAAIITLPAFFLLGAALVYYIVIPMALRFFLGMQETSPNGVSITMQTRVSEYLTFIMTLIMAFGVCFQLPVILTLLARIGLVGSPLLKKGRKYAIVVFLIISALLAPPDPFSQVGLTVPLYLLYEFSIQAVIWVEKQKAKKEAAEKAALGL